MNVQEPGKPFFQTSYKGKGNGMIKSTKPLKTNDKEAYGDNVKPEKGNNTTVKGPKGAGSAQQMAMKPKDVACKKY
jgi:hypothetical protein